MSLVTKTVTTSSIMAKRLKYLRSYFSFFSRDLLKAALYCFIFVNNLVRLSYTRGRIKGAVSSHKNVSTPG